MTDPHDDPRWDELDGLLADGDLDGADAVLAALAQTHGEDHELVVHERAVLAWERDGPEAAIPLLDQLLRDHPDHADAHYLRGIASSEVEDFEATSRHFLEVLRLDIAADAERGYDSAELDRIEATADRVLAELPVEFRGHLREVPIVLEARPHPELVGEGFDPRSLGLFEGLEQGRLAAGDAAVAPTRIVLFYANLLDEFPEPEDLDAEVEITILHEVGHFFGLDEDDMERLGLE